MSTANVDGTRYFARKRAIIIVVLLFLAASLFTVWSQSTAANSSTTSAINTASTTSSSEVTVTSSSSSSAVTNSTSTETGLYAIDREILVQLVNRSDVELIRSRGSIRYYVVISPPNTRQVIGLIYLTTDVALDWTYGYNSYVGVLVFVDQTGTIKSLETWQLQESWGFLVTQEWVSKQFVNRTVYEPLQVGEDVDGISSATITSRSIASGVREAGRMVVDDYRINPPIITVTSTTTLTTKSSTSNFTSTQTAQSLLSMVRQEDLIDASVMAGMFVAAAVAYEKKDERLRYVVLGGSLLFMGIYAERMISIIDLTALTSMHLPPLFLNLYWYVLYCGALATSLIWGRLYCGYLCPFGAFAQIVNRISPIKRKIPIRIHSKLVYLKYPILAIVTVGVLFGVIWITGIEPFQTFFHLHGDWWMWAVMIGAIVLSVPFNRFYCSYVCPAGAVMSLVGRLRVKEIKRWAECRTCKVCERACPQGAVMGSRISVLECMNCRDCERNYLDAKICPHYVHDRLSR